GRGSSPIRWALEHFTPEERRLFGGADGQPAVERDKAIVKGVFRRAMQCCEGDGFPSALAKLNKALKDANVKPGTLLPEAQGILVAEVLPLYAVYEALHNFLDPCRTGNRPTGAPGHQMGGQALAIDGFPVRVDTPDAAANDDVL